MEQQVQQSLLYQAEQGLLNWAFLIRGYVMWQDFKKYTVPTNLWEQPIAVPTIFVLTVGPKNL